jgi:hypothetical protein
MFRLAKLCLVDSAVLAMSSACDTQVRVVHFQVLYNCLIQLQFPNCCQFSSAARGVAAFAHAPPHTGLLQVGRAFQAPRKLVILRCWSHKRSSLPWLWNAKFLVRQLFAIKPLSKYFNAGLLTRRLHIEVIPTAPHHRANLWLEKKFSFYLRQFIFPTYICRFNITWTRPPGRTSQTQFGHDHPAGRHRHNLDTTTGQDVTDTIWTRPPGRTSQTQFGHDHRTDRHQLNILYSYI